MRAITIIGLDIAKSVSPMTIRNQDTKRAAQQIHPASAKRAPAEADAQRSELCRVVMNPDGAYPLRSVSPHASARTGAGTFMGAVPSTIHLGAQVRGRKWIRNPKTRNLPTST
jgi:hypothetical protein